MGNEDQRRNERIAMRIFRSEGQEQKAWLGEPSTNAREGGGEGEGGGAGEKPLAKEN